MSDNIRVGLIGYGYASKTFHAPPVSYTHLRAHETRHDIVCRLLLEKKNLVCRLLLEKKKTHETGRKLV